MLDSNLNDDHAFEEMHYHHTINDFVELLVVYGLFNVMKDVFKRIHEADLEERL
jgi:hypothetical protein